nr:ATP-binding protein [uncultured Carboxylicivirga sp.]
MSQMLTDISRIVNEDISNRISQYDVLYEAIINSIHANSTEIVCELGSFDNPQKEDGKDLLTKKLDTIKITDNGDGLNEENYKSFCEYRTGLKKNLGCKGVGRFVFLKVYKNVKYQSLLKGTNEKKTFSFNFDFDTENIQIDEDKVVSNETTVELSVLNSSYLNIERHIDRRIPLKLSVIKDKVLTNLIPTLFFYQKKGVDIKIVFKDGEKELAISKEDIPNFSEKTFDVKNYDGTKNKFSLHYQIEKEKGKFKAYHCAANRTVCEFSDKDFKMTLPYGYSGFFLLESKYFDSHVNNERNDFDIFPVKTDMFSTISWEMINCQLQDEITKLVKEGIPETKKLNSAKIQEIQEERPYLVNYINETDIEMAGFIDKKQIIEKAKKRFDSAKENVLSNSGKETYSDYELHEAIQLTQNELVSYIYDRVQVIERLKTMVRNKEQVESVIHNLFMQQHTDDDYYCIGKNNLWLLDDRFTSYSYAASDKRIKDIVSTLELDGDEIDNEADKPDLALFFSQNPNNSDSLKSVLVEIKPFSDKNKSDRKKFHGIQQLVDYVEAFKVKERIDEIWAFLITDVDDKLANRLKKDDYTPLFSTKAPIYHRFYKELGMSIYVIGAETLISDAESKNKVFLDIIRKQSKLTKILDNANAEIAMKS